MEEIDNLLSKIEEIIEQCNETPSEGFKKTIRDISEKLKNNPSEIPREPIIDRLLQLIATTGSYGLTLEMNEIISLCRLLYQQTGNEAITVKWGYALLNGIINYNNNDDLVAAEKLLKELTTLFKSYPRNIELSEIYAQGCVGILNMYATEGNFRMTKNYLQELKLLLNLSYASQDLISIIAEGMVNAIESFANAKKYSTDQIQWVIKEIKTLVETHRDSPYLDKLFKNACYNALTVLKNS
ncbi:MAG: hypothetical protein GF308_00245 [Candidatus Heimdallarchaeota archaeon]|nr:hypothetical protein [Candidatus Heimdallarchaeota archaeon]